MSEYKIFTSESVSEGHPDKMADQISDAVLDAMLKDDPNSIRVIGSLSGSDTIMNKVLFIGTYPGLNEDMIKYEIEIIKNFAKYSKSIKK